MYIRSILLSGAAALSASAMLVVPEMEPKLEAVEDGFMNVHPMLFEDIRRATVDVPCTECPFRENEKHGAVSWTDNKPSTLMLDFTIEENRLMANGRQIFPPIPPSPILAVQQLEDGEESDPMPVGYALEVMPLPSPADTPETEFLDVRFTVLDLESHPVPVDTVAIILIVDPSGQLYIAKTEVEKTAPAPERLSWKKCQGKPKCLQELLVARVRGLLASAKERLFKLTSKGGRKGCHGKNKGMGHHGPHPHGDFGPDGLFPGFNGPEDFGPKGHHHSGPFVPENAGRPHHNRPPPPNGAFAHTFSRVVRFIVVPAILGVLAGLTASAVGMLVGQAVVFCWQRYRGTQPKEHKAAWEEGDACEKQGLMVESEDVLPEYAEESRRGSMDKN
ncbi:hypothetical protein N7532_007896 [Penicillium argentinense]|uniref:DUF7728 domain-containing protein n=1 Tax=Penicillium argentinense TaxID=1131581 RepID=A0A9W9EWE2_9EURO|nr:uncharacterized protein N7532_007896 [Penicillium argentinense]KAJ5089212.1 hypothetical protein N7532_007896 [Penicillium argentinense]